MMFKKQNFYDFRIDWWNRSPDQYERSDMNPSSTIKIIFFR